eukprot:CAMPEP_0202724784 /NCGR_PEP_ID=MMETSP1385-20130828/176436_1 /ASSEMBLY_ACC=CAM_ASM_000861 /TAXON_ID=933848 /ORGANISM="Elphidium margaritaceum" /LENGTH=37 /DNA_ID= /DNA_START= /DNA_END= /DNA_ORIENTATION=
MTVLASASNGTVLTRPGIIAVEEAVTDRTHNVLVLAV